MAMNETASRVICDSEYEGPAIVHLMGRQKVAGRIRSVVLAGAGFLRIDVPAFSAPDGSMRHPAMTVYRSPAALWGIDPVDEATMQVMAALWRPEPVEPWELLAAQQAARPSRPPDGIPGHDDAQVVDFGEEEDPDPRGHEAGDEDEDDDFDQEMGF